MQRSDLPVYMGSVFLPFVIYPKGQKIFWNVLYYSILYNIYSAITIMNLNNGREGERESLLWFLDANTWLSKSLDLSLDRLLKYDFEIKIFFFDLLILMGIASYVFRLQEFRVCNNIFITFHILNFIIL